MVSHSRTALNWFITAVMVIVAIQAIGWLYRHIVQPNPYHIEVTK